MMPEFMWPFEKKKILAKKKVSKIISASYSSVKIIMNVMIGRPMHKY